MRTMSARTQITCLVRRPSHSLLRAAEFVVAASAGGAKYGEGSFETGLIRGRLKGQILIVKVFSRSLESRRIRPDFGLGPSLQCLALLRVRTPPFAPIR